MLFLKKAALHFVLIFTVLIVAVSCSEGPRLSNDELLKAGCDAAMKGNWKDASSLAGRAVKQDPKDINARVLLALALENSNHLELAIDEIKAASKLAPGDFMVQFNFGRMLFKQGRYGEAVAPLKIASELRPDNMDSIILLAQASSALKLPEAANYYAIAATNPRFSSKPDPFNELGIIYLRDKDPERALKYFIKAYKLAPDNYIITLNLAICLDKYSNDPAKALNFYKKYLKLTEKNPEIEAKRLKISRRVKEIEPDKSN